jgi:hypothetical protein
VSPSQIDVPFGGSGDIELRVGTTAACAWTAVSQASWITVRSGASGTGNGRVHIEVAANVQTATRTGVVVIGGQTVTVTQAGFSGQDVTLTDVISNLSGSCPNRQFTMSGATVIVTSGTKYMGKNDCGDLRDGRTVRVRGRGQADGTILADRIDRFDGLTAPEEGVR